MDKKLLKIIGVLIVILMILFIPKVKALNDGGTKIYKSLTYEITKVHKIKEDSLNEFYEGTIVKIFGKEVYNNLKNENIVVDSFKEENEKISNYYEKTIDNITINIEIPKDWKYEEISKSDENDFYKYGLKLYKNKSDKYAVLYFYNQKFGVCGTGRTSKKMNLNNGIEAVIGYYDGKDIWQDISFYETNQYIAIINQGLDNEESEEILEFIKTFNIIQNSENN